MNADPQYLHQQKQNLNDLVTERNELIHHGLANFDPNSAESCQQLIARLDEQNIRILTQLKAAKQLVETCKEGFQKVLFALNSEKTG